MRAFRLEVVIGMPTTYSGGKYTYHFHADTAAEAERMAQDRISRIPLATGESIDGSYLTEIGIAVQPVSKRKTNSWKPNKYGAKV